MLSMSGKGIFGVFVAFVVVSVICILRLERSQSETNEEKSSHHDRWNACDVNGDIDLSRTLGMVYWRGMSIGK